MKEIKNYKITIIRLNPREQRTQKDQLKHLSVSLIVEKSIASSELMNQEDLILVKEFMKNKQNNMNLNLK